jgi:hypothetical protein
LPESDVQWVPRRCVNTPRRDQSTCDGPMAQRVPVAPGDRYGLLTVVKELPTKQLKHHSVRVFEVRCDCGMAQDVYLGKLRSGRTKSCRTCSRQSVREKNTIHGMRRSKEYGVWMSMLARCNNPKANCYHSYGGRGVVVCDRWDPAKGGSFANFIEDMGRRPSDDHQIDKEAVDPTNTVYCPEKVRWVLRRENMQNTSRSRYLTYEKRTMLLTEWASELGIGVSCLHRRIYKSGWSIERAFNTPSGKWRSTISMDRIKSKATA